MAQLILGTCNGKPYHAVNHFDAPPKCSGRWRMQMADTALAELEWRPTHRHLKTGGLYQVIARGIDATNAQPAEDREVVIYRNVHGQWFCRTVREFDDGRFELLPATGEKGK